MSILAFRSQNKPRPCPAGGLSGLFFLQSPSRQHERVRLLAARRFSAPTIASTCRISVAEVERILEMRQ